MFDIDKLKLFNFKSFKGSHTFVFPGEPGLYFILGSNEKEPRLEGNGAGKSTILDAIVWCLYGQTPRGLKAGDIITRGCKEAAVEVHLAVGELDLIVKRTQNPNSLTVTENKKTVVIDQEHLNKLLRINQQAFTYAVTVPQFGQSFFELRPGEKLTLFSQIMDLDFWLEKSKQAETSSLELSKDIDTLIANISLNKDQVVNLNHQIVELAEKYESFEDECTAIIKQLQKKYSELQVGMMVKRKGIIECQENIKSRIKELQLKGDSLKSQENALASHRSTLRKFEQQQTIISTTLDAKEKALRKLGKLEGTCPTCRQRITGGHLKAEKSKVENEIEDIRVEYKEITKSLLAAQSFEAKIAKNIRVVWQTLEKIQIDITNWELRASEFSNAISFNSKEEKDLSKQVKAEKNRSNPYADLIKRARESLVGLQALLKQAQKLLAEITAEQAAVSYWIKGFKKIRLFIIEETLTSLEIEVNNSLTSLGLIDWTVQFDIERENKSGGITKGFTVLVKNSSWPEPIKFESWSGGESQRLQLAGDLGLANLIMTQAGFQNSIEFYDEPSQYLNQAGLLDLAETLHQRALTDKKRIFLIDHHSIEFGEFADTFTVIKDDKGSRFKPS